MGIIVTWLYFLAWVFHLFLFDNLGQEMIVISAILLKYEIDSWSTNEAKQLMSRYRINKSKNNNFLLKLKAVSFHYFQLKGEKGCCILTAIPMLSCFRFRFVFVLNISWKRDPLWWQRLSGQRHHKRHLQKKETIFKLKQETNKTFSLEHLMGCKTSASFVNAYYKIQFFIL